VIKLEEYLQDNDTSPFKRWFSSLDALAAFKVSNALMRLELGNTSNIKWFDGLGECRINWGPGYRTYLIQEGKRLIILFGGGDKIHSEKSHQTGENACCRVPGPEKSRKAQEVTQWLSHAATNIQLPNAPGEILSLPRFCWTRPPLCF
jgi:putative addiction module killer protein